MSINDGVTAGNPPANGTSSTRWRGIKNFAKKNSNEAGKRPSISARESDLLEENDVDISLIHRRVYLLSAGIGDTNKQYNKYKGKIGLVAWCINIVIHFGLDFYEANTIFDISWASCIGLFLVTLVACCISMNRHSVPWFLRGVKKLKKEGKYPKTLKRVRLLARFLPLSACVFAVGAAVGQFGCYWADGALRLSFSKNNSTITVPSEVETLINVLRATSLIHIFYGFSTLLVFHMTLIFMLQSSMVEYNERMGKLFREVPINICFTDAVNLFSARAKFVRDGSKKCSIVLTTLLVACCTSFVLNAYNFLFLQKYAIYIWFALAPLIWAVVPLMGAAWVTKTYWKYKLVVVNAWVDIPEEHELEAAAHSAMHHGKRPKSPVKRMWGSIIGKTAMKDTDISPMPSRNSDVEKEEVYDGETDEVNLTKYEKSEEKLHVQESHDDVRQTENTNSTQQIKRRNSEVVISISAKNNENNKSNKRVSSMKIRQKTPEILLTDYDGERVENSTPKSFRLKPLRRKISDSSLIEPDANPDAAVQIHENNKQRSSSDGNISRKNTTDNECRRSESVRVRNKKEVRIDIENPEYIPTDPLPLKLPEVTEVTDIGYSNTAISESDSVSLSSSIEDLTQEVDGATSETDKIRELSISDAVEDPSDNDPCMSSLNVPAGLSRESEDPQRKPGKFLTGISKTFHKWRTKTKKKKHFNYEKYIIYLESILPTVGFSVGGVVIDWNGIYTFIVIMTFMVGVFAQEAFFGN